jgi:hypothetical protein
MTNADASIIGFRLIRTRQEQQDRLLWRRWATVRSGALEPHKPTRASCIRSDSNASFMAALGSATDA